MTWLAAEPRPQRAWGLPVQWTVTYDVADDRRRARAARASSRTTGSSAFTTAQSEASWFANTRALAAT